MNMEAVLQEKEKLSLTQSHFACEIPQLTDLVNESGIYGKTNFHPRETIEGTLPNSLDCNLL